jgi:hypothetical protein
MKNITKERLYADYPYGAYYRKNGEKVLHNRYYQPLDDPERWVTDIVRQEWYYSDWSSLEKKIHGARTQTPVWSRSK